MKWRKRMVVASLVSVSLAVGIVVAVARTENRPVGRRFPPIAFGEVADAPGDMRFVRQTEFPSVAKAVRVYRVKPLASKKDTLLQIMKALPIVHNAETEKNLQQLERMSEPSAQSEEPLSRSIGGWGVDVYGDGQFYIDREMPGESLESWEKIPSAPTEQEAQKIADEFLKAIPSLMNVHCVNIGPGRILSRGLGNKPGDTIVTQLSLAYSAEVDGIPQHGAVSVSVGAGPIVLSVNSRLRQVVPDEEIRVLSPEEAYSKLEKKEFHLADAPMWDATAKIKSIKLVYWLAPTAKHIPYLMPMYVFSGEAIAEGRKTTPFRVYVQAARHEYLETATER